MKALNLAGAGGARYTTQKLNSDFTKHRRDAVRRGYQPEFTQRYHGQRFYRNSGLTARECSRDGAEYRPSPHWHGSRAQMPSAEYENLYYQ